MALKIDFAKTLEEAGLNGSDWGKKMGWHKEQLYPYINRVRYPRRGNEALLRKWFEENNIEIFYDQQN